MMLASGKPEAFWRNKPFPKSDAVIPRIGASITFYGAAVVRQLEMMGVYVCNPADAILNSRDKLRSLQILSQHDVGIPPTGFSRRTDLAKNLLTHVDGPPAIVKLLEGTQGAGVIKVDSRSGFNSTVDAFHSVGQNILVQKFLEDADAADIRVIVIGNRVVAAMRRKATGDEFRSNVHRGGSTVPIRPDAAIRGAATKAAKVLGLGFAGVDLMETGHGPMVIEVNSSPGLEGIEKASGVDIGEVLVEHLEAEVATRRARQKSRRAADKSRAAAATARAAAKRAADGGERPRGR